MKVRSSALKSWLGTFLLVGLPAANAEILVGWDFGHNLPLPSTATSAPAIIHSGVSLTGALDGEGGLSAATHFTHATALVGDNTGIAASGTPFGDTQSGNWGATSNGASGANLAAAITGNHYFTFTLTANTAGTLNVTDFSANGAIAGVNAAEKLQVLAQVNGGTTWDATAAITPETTITTIQGLSEWNDIHADLSGNPNFQGIDKVEFRVYVWGGTGGSGSSRLNIDQVVVEGDVGAPTEPTWQVNGTGDWSNLASWVPSVPNGVGAIARFDDALPLTNSVTATLDTPVTVGDLSLNSNAGITIGGLSALTLNKSGVANISSTKGSHQISAGMSLVSPLEVALSTGTSLNLSGVVSGSNPVTKSGAGQLSLSGDFSGFSGGLTATGGTLNVTGSGGSTDITVNSGVTLSGEGSHMGTLNLAANSKLSVDPVSFTAFTTGTLAPTAPALVSTTSVPAGTFTVLNYTTYGGTAATDFVGLSQRYDFVASSGSINATPAGAASITWKGDNPTNSSYWDFGVANWTGVGGMFYNGDTVNFSDTGVGAVSVRSVVTPATVNFTNATGVFTLDDVTANAQTLSATTGGINVTGAGDVALNVKVTGNTNITHSGTGNLTLGSTVINDFVGSVAVNSGGTLTVGSNTFLGNASNTITIGGGGTLDLKGVNNFQSYGENSFILANGAKLSNTTTTNLNQAFTNQLQFGGDVTLSGSGRIDIFGNIDVTGTDITITVDYVQPSGTNVGSVIGGDNSSESIGLWLIKEGSIYVNSAGSLGDNAVVRVEDGGILRGNRANAEGDWNTINDIFLEAGSQIQKRDQDNVFNLNGTVTVEGNAQINPGGFDDVIALNAVLTGPGNLTFNNQGLVRVGTGFNDTTFAGNLIIGDNAGNKTLQLANLDQEAEAAIVTTDIVIEEIGNESFDVEVVDSLDTLTLSGNISGSGAAGLTKVNAGKLILSGDNSYTGGTKIYNGIVLVNGNSANATGAVTVNGSGTLGGTGTIGGTIDLSGKLAPGTSIGTLTATGAITGTGTLEIEVDGATADKLVVTDSINVSGLTLNVSAINPLAGPVVIVDGSASANVTGSFAAPLPAGYNVIYGYDDGSDTKNIAIAPAAGFSSWITGEFTNGTVTNQGPNDDDDNDGVSNLVEYAIAGHDPTVPDPNIGDFTGNTLSYTKSTTAVGISYALVSSTDLGIADNWEEIANVPGYVTYVNDETSISVAFSITGASPPKNFVRLQVTED